MIHLNALRPIGGKAALAAPVSVLLSALAALGCHNRLTPVSSRSPDASAPAAQNEEALDEWRRALAEWEMDPKRSRPLPAVTLRDVPVLVGLLRESVALAAVAALRSDDEVLAAAVPGVIAEFRRALEARVPSRAEYAPASKAELGDTNVRLSALKFFAAAGPVASAVGEDLVTLLKRARIDGEYSGHENALARAIAAVLSEDPTPLVAASRHEHAGVRLEACHAMRYMMRARDVVGPALAERIGDVSDAVVREAVSALGELRWSSREIVEALEARIGIAKSDLGPLKRGLAHLREIASTARTGDSK